MTCTTKPSLTILSNSPSPSRAEWYGGDGGCGVCAYSRVRRLFLYPLESLSPPMLYYRAMTNKELELLGKAFEDNRSNAFHVLYDPLDSAEVRFHRQNNFAVLVTLVDYLRGDIEGLPSPLSELARNNADSSYPSPPEDNGDPNPEATETLKHLGSLGIQSLEEITGYKYDDAGHILLRIKGRFADSGWMENDPRIAHLINIMETWNLPFPLIP